MNQEFLTNVVEVFTNALKDIAFSVTDYRHDSDNFGNIFLVLSSKDLKVRFIKERGQLFIDLAPISDSTWFRAEDVLSLIPSTHISSDSSISEDIVNISKIIATNYSAIIDSFSDDKYPLTKSALDNLNDERIRRYERT